MKLFNTTVLRLFLVFIIVTLLISTENVNGQNSVTNPRKTPLRKPHEMQQSLEDLFSGQSQQQNADAAAGHVTGGQMDNSDVEGTDGVSTIVEDETGKACELWVQIQHAYTPNVVHSQDLAFQVAFTNGATEFRRTGSRTYVPGLISSFNIGQTICGAQPIGVSIEDIINHDHLGEHKDQCRILDVKLRYQGAYYLYNGPIMDIDDEAVYFALDGPAFL